VESDVSDHGVRSGSCSNDRADREAMVQGMRQLISPIGPISPIRERPQTLEHEDEDDYGGKKEPQIPLGTWGS
jgi:hypothetical protein